MGQYLRASFRGLYRSPKVENLVKLAVFGSFTGLLSCFTFFSPSPLPFPSLPFPCPSLPCPFPSSFPLPLSLAPLLLPFLPLLPFPHVFRIFPFLSFFFRTVCGLSNGIIRLPVTLNDAEGHFCCLKAFYLIYLGI